MPTTRFAGSPQASRMTHTMTSSGLVMVITKASGQCFLIAAPTVDDHLGVDADQIVAAHAGLARDAGGDDHDIGAGDVGIVVGAVDHRVVALDRRALDDVERLPLRHPLDDVEQHDVAQFLEPGEQRDRAADLAGADQRDLVACHGECLVLRAPGSGAGRPPLTANPRGGQGDGRRRKSIVDTAPLLSGKHIPRRRGQENRMADPNGSAASSTPGSSTPGSSTHARIIDPGHSGRARGPERRRRPGRAAGSGRCHRAFARRARRRLRRYRDEPGLHLPRVLQPGARAGARAGECAGRAVVDRVGADPGRRGQIRAADHARRQSGRGRDPGLAGAGAGGGAKPRAPGPSSSCWRSAARRCSTATA